MPPHSKVPHIKTSVSRPTSTTPSNPVPHTIKKKCLTFALILSGILNEPVVAVDGMLQINSGEHSTVFQGIHWSNFLPLQNPMPSLVVMAYLKLKFTPLRLS